MFKDASAVLINGVGIAATCAAGVYVWSRRIGLALLIGLSMVI
jgi:magnesium transporter